MTGVSTFPKLVFLTIVLMVFCNLHLTFAQSAPTVAKFDFGPGKVAPGYKQVLADTLYSKEIGYGFEPGSNVTCVSRSPSKGLRGNLCISDKPFYFSVALPEGNYLVSITFGDAENDT